MYIIMYYEGMKFPKPHWKYICWFVEYLREIGHSPRFIGFNGKMLSYPPSRQSMIMAVP